MFRFTIRELILVTIIAGVSIGWWMDHQRNRKELEYRFNSINRLEEEVVGLHSRLSRAIYGPKSPPEANKTSPASEEHLHEAVK